MLEFWEQRVGMVAKDGVQGPPARKERGSRFKLPPGCDGRTDPGPGFWETFPRQREFKGSVLVSAVKLMSLALAVGGVNMDMVNLVCRDLEEGADIGCRGASRGQTVSGNAASCQLYPEQITDAVGGWLEKGFAAGPFSKEEVPEGAKINGMMCRPKPSGAVRVILNMSAPEGMSVNDGIDASEFPTEMSSTTKWLAVLNKAGKGCLMTKADWADAYKHIWVRAADRVLQWFSWLGMFFVELCLVFGTASSPGLYDRFAKVVLDLALAVSKFPREMVCQYLDDVCAAAPAGSAALGRFREAYQQVAEQLGVKLASEDDPDKAFAPATVGTVLGVRYDTVAWTWSIPEDKLGRLNEQVLAALHAVALPRHEVWSLVGRIIHYCPLVASGRFNIHHLININGKTGGRNDLVPLEGGVKRQLRFWLIMLNATSGLASIPQVWERAPAWAREFFTDAAGGSTSYLGAGCGGVSGDWWFYLPWGRKINTGVSYRGRRLAGKMSALELVGPLVCVCADPDMVRCRAIRIWVDNIGSVRIWRKGYSNSCSLSTTLVRALAAVAAALGCRVFVEKVARCSSPPAVMADALSKAAFGKFREAAAAAAWPLRLEPAWVPPALLRWVASPVEDECLGRDILRDLRPRTELLGDIY